MTKPFVKDLATHYFGCSDKALDWLYNYTGIRNKAVMINNGIDVNIFKYDQEHRRDIRKELNLDGFNVLGHVGRFSKVKNHQFFCQYSKHILEFIRNQNYYLSEKGNC